MPRLNKSEKQHSYHSQLYHKQQQQWGNQEDQQFYHSTAWRRCREQVLANEPICRYCWTLNNKVVVATVVDHIKRIKDGGERYENYNLQPLCATCHNTKSSFEGRGKIDKKTFTMYYTEGMHMYGTI